MAPRPGECPEGAEHGPSQIGRVFGRAGTKSWHLGGPSTRKGQGPMDVSSQTQRPQPPRRPEMENTCARSSPACSLGCRRGLCCEDRGHESQARVEGARQHLSPAEPAQQLHQVDPCTDAPRAPFRTNAHSPLSRQPWRWGVGRAGSQSELADSAAKLGFCQPGLEEASPLGRLPQGRVASTSLPPQVLSPNSGAKTCSGDPVSVPRLSVTAGLEAGKNSAGFLLITPTG